MYFKIPLIIIIIIMNKEMYYIIFLMESPMQNRNFFLYNNYNNNNSKNKKVFLDIYINIIMKFRILNKRKLYHSFKHIKQTDFDEGKCLKKCKRID